MMETIATLSTALGLGVGAGVNAYATFLVYGLLARFYPQMFSGDLAEFFSSTPVLIALGVLYAIEFVADKVPVIDHAWDAVHTFIRPLAGAVVAFSSATEMPTEITVAASILGGSAALGSHVLKSSVRAASTATTGGAANPILSLGEDVFAVVQAVVAVFLPFVVLAVVAVVLVAAMIWLARRGRRSAPAR